MDLTEMAIEILQIKQRISYVSEVECAEHYFDLKVFEQSWGNTSCGFESIGGSAITWSRTYVFIPKRRGKYCLVFFGGQFGYKIPKENKQFRSDLDNENIAGVQTAKTRYAEEEK